MWTMTSQSRQLIYVMQQIKKIDGEMTVHGAFDKKGKDKWDKVIFSVKTGNQCKPEFLRELQGTMKEHNAEYGCLILDKVPTQTMLTSLINKNKIKYQYSTNLPTQYFPTLQILTSQQIIDGAKLDLPPTIQRIKKGAIQVNFNEMLELVDVYL